MAGKKKMKMTVKAKLVISISLLSIIVIVIVSTCNVYMSQRSLESKQLEYHQATTREYGNEIAGWFDEKYAIVKGLADNYKSLDTMTDEQLNSYIQSVYSMQDEVITDVYYGMSNKNIYDGLANEFEDSYDCTTREWFVKTVNAGKSICTAPYEDAITGNLVISLTEPIYEGNEIVGVASADIALTELITLVGEADFAEGVYGFMLDADGNYLVHQNEAYMPSNGELVNIKNTTETEVIKKYESLNGIECFETTAYDGTSKYISLINVGDYGFTFGIAIPSSLVNADTNQLKLVMSIMALVELIIMVVIIYTIVKKVLNPIDELKGVAGRLAKGDITVRANITSEDEFGELMTEFNAMIDSIEEQARVAEQVARGNLDVSITPKSKEDVLSMSLKKLIDDNNYTLKHISEASNGVSVGASEVAAASQSLAQGATEQSSAITQITASMNDIATKVSENANSAENASELTKSTREGVLGGSNKMHEMVNAMNEISTSSEDIAKIVKTIEDIAFQTNILAINAAVEAARAGAHGKGFGVVAEEVRNLSQKVTDAATETNELLGDSINRIKYGANMAEDTAEALSVIVKNVNSVTDLVEDIASGSKTSAAIIREINEAISQVADVIQNNSATSEECASSSEVLSTQAELLREQISKFNLR